MAVRLFLLFVVIPITELFLLFEFASRTSAGWAIALVVLTGLVGYWLAQSQGLRTYRRIQSDLLAGKIPTDALLDGMMIFLAGAFLLTPGILTDLVGFSLLIPVSRSYYRRIVLGWVKSRFTWRQMGGGSFHSSFFSQDAPDSSEIVDAEVDQTTVDGKIVQHLEQDEPDASD